MTAEKQDYQDLAHYSGQIGACLEAAETAMEGLHLGAEDEGDRKLNRARLERAIWLVWAARTVNDQLARETNLR